MTLLGLLVIFVFILYAKNDPEGTCIYSIWILHFFIFFILYLICFECWIVFGNDKVLVQQVSNRKNSLENLTVFKFIWLWLHFAESHCSQCIQARGVFTGVTERAAAGRPEENVSLMCPTVSAKWENDWPSLLLCHCSTQNIGQRNQRSESGLTRILLVSIIILILRQEWSFTRLYRTVVGLIISKREFSAYTWKQRVFWSNQNKEIPFFNFQVK